LRSGRTVHAVQPRQAVPAVLANSAGLAGSPFRPGDARRAVNAVDASQTGRASHSGEAVCARSPWLSHYYGGRKVVGYETGVAVKQKIVATKMVGVVVIDICIVVEYLTHIGQLIHKVWRPRSPAAATKSTAQARGTRTVGRAAVHAWRGLSHCRRRRERHGRAMH
jgi:hypothetical protein